MPKCVFCHAPALKVLFENEAAFVIEDINPVSPGHCLVVSRRHVGSVFDLTQQETCLLWELVKKARWWLDKKCNPDGYNIGINCGNAAGQTIAHLHVHLIPRYVGDIKNPVGGVRGVIPEKRIY